MTVWIYIDTRKEVGDKDHPASQTHDLNEIEALQDGLS